MQCNDGVINFGTNISTSSLAQNGVAYDFWQKGKRKEKKSTYILYIYNTRRIYVMSQHREFSSDNLLTSVFIFLNGFEHYA